MTENTTTPIDDTRTQIMDAFGTQLAESGYPGISLVGVARTVGIQKPSIYHHFPGGKEDLYVAVAERFVTALHARLTAALATEGALEARLVALAEANADAGGTAISFEQRIYDTLPQVSDATREHISQLYVSKVLGPVVDFFTAAVDAGDVAGDPEFLMNAFLHLARATDLTTAPDSAARLVTLFLDGARK